jgi:hypothetical protein
MAIAHALREATIVGDSEQLHADLSRLRTALVRHLSDEQTWMLGDLAAIGSIIRDGQRRLLRLVDGVVFEALRDEPTCTCLVRAAEIELALRRQVRLEATLLRHA